MCPGGRNTLQSKRIRTRNLDAANRDRPEWAIAVGRDAVNCQKTSGDGPIGGTMQPTTQTIHEIFEKERCYTVPLFQRAYVWTLEDQWEPLWEDIERQARSCLIALKENRQVTTSHFLGAVVFNVAKVFGRGLARAEVIDGQQRLTTLQIFLAALRDFAKAADDGVADDAGRLTFNPIRDNESEDAKRAEKQGKNTRETKRKGPMSSPLCCQLGSKPRRS